MEVNNIWISCLSIVEKTIDKRAFDTWFKPIIPLKLVGDNLTIQVPNQYFYEWLEKYHSNVLAHAIRKVISDQATLTYAIKQDNFEDVPTSTKGSNSTVPSFVNENYDPSKVRHQGIKVTSNLQPSLIFSSFVECENNRFAFQVAKDIAMKKSHFLYNPLLIYGDVGIGKTHLVHAIGNGFKAINDNANVIYTSSEQFTSQFVNAISQKNINDFVGYYQQTDVLIVDDIQYLTGKESTQKIFFNIFNHLSSLGKQIIITADRPAIELKGIMDRLVNRFTAGLAVQMKMPDYESRVEIIQKKVDLYGADDIPQEVVNYIALNVTSSVRELEGVVVSLIALASYSAREINLELAKETLKTIITNIAEDVGVDYIARFVAEHYGINIEQISSGSRKKEIALPRQVAMYMCKEFTDHTYKMIGSHFGGRDHSTVIHAIKTVSDRMDVDKDFKKSILSLKSRLKSI